MQISKETVEYIAHLAKLALSQEEFSRAEQALTDIIGHAEILNSLSSKDSPTVSANEFICSRQNLLRPDTPDASTPKEHLLENAALHDNDYFIVPKTVD